MKVNFDGVGHLGWVLVAKNNRKVRDGSGWGRAGVKTLKKGDVHFCTWQGSAESEKTSKGRLKEVVTRGGQTDWSKNWEIKQCWLSSSIGQDAREV
jgi:hypothetical protein